MGGWVAPKRVVAVKEFSMRELPERSEIAASTLTMRQTEVLQLISQRLTIKEIAARLNVSESAINQRIRALKERLGVNTQRELAEWHSRFASSDDDIGAAEEFDPCSETACRKNHLPLPGNLGQTTYQDGPGSVASLHDAYDFRIAAPWQEILEPRVVPGVLDGEHAGWIRSVAIIVIVIGIFTAIIMALGAMQAVSDAIASR